MIRELVATTILTASISNAIQQNYIVKDINWTSNSQYFTQVEYYEGAVESGEYITYKNIDPITYEDGISKIQQFMTKKSVVYPNENTYTDMYIYTLYQNKAVSVTNLTQTLDAVMYEYDSTYYYSITDQTCHTFNLPTNQLIIDMLNGYQPTTFNQLNTIATQTSTVDIGIENPTWTNYQRSSINDLKETVQLFSGNTGSYVYSVRHIQIEYNPNVYTSTQPPQDMTYFVNTETLTINYRYEQSTNAEVIDLPGLMFEVLGMPFAWISTAFNFTIFPGTRYEVNISHIVMAIVVAGIAIYIVKRILN